MFQIFVNFFGNPLKRVTRLTCLKDFGVLPSDKIRFRLKNIELFISAELASLKILLIVESIFLVLNMSENMTRILCKVK